MRIPLTAGLAGSLTLAAFFFNLYFWVVPAANFGRGKPPWFAVMAAIAVACITGLGFLFPALLVQARGRPLHEAVAECIGVWPAALFRALAAVICLFWIVKFTRWIPHALVSTLSASHRDLNAVESLVVASVIVLFVFATAVQPIANRTKLALFSNKLALALLIAGAIRVRHFLSAESPAGQFSAALQDVIAEPILYSIPIALLSAGMAAPCASKGEVKRVAAFGIVLPMTVSLLAVYFLERAAFAMRSDLAKLSGILTALWGGDATRFLGPWHLVVVITMFGGARLAAQCLIAACSSPKFHVPLPLQVAAAIALFQIDPPYRLEHALFSAAAWIATAVSAILALAYFTGPRLQALTTPLSWYGRSTARAARTSTTGSPSAPPAPPENPAG